MNIKDSLKKKVRDYNTLFYTKFNDGGSWRIDITDFDGGIVDTYTSTDLNSVIAWKNDNYPNATEQ